MFGAMLRGLTRMGRQLNTRIEQDRSGTTQRLMDGASEGALFVTRTGDKVRRLRRICARHTMFDVFQVTLAVVPSAVAGQNEVKVWILCGRDCRVRTPSCASSRHESTVDNEARISEEHCHWVASGWLPSLFLTHTIENTAQQVQGRQRHECEEEWHGARYGSRQPYMARVRCPACDVDAPTRYRRCSWDRCERSEL